LKLLFGWEGLTQMVIKMGGHSSKNRKEKIRQRIALQMFRQEEALKLFNYRVKSYSYSYNCTYYEYIEWCNSQYYIDCNIDIDYASYGYGMPQYKMD
jgi:hypothetical protein